MRSRSSPNFMTSGAMGLLAGVAIAGGLLMAMSGPATGQAAPLSAPETTSTPDRAAPVEPSGQVYLTTFGNSTARAFALAHADENRAKSRASQPRGEEVARDPDEWAQSDAPAAGS